MTTSEPGSPSRLYRWGWAFYLLLAIAGGGWLSQQNGGFPWRRLAVPAQAWLDLPLGALAGASLLLAWDLGRRRLRLADELEAQLRTALGGVEASQALALALLSGFAEELFFRGAAQQAWGLLPATILFALLHSGPGAAFRLWTVFAAVAGLLFGALVLWRGNLLAPMVAHGLVNAVNLRRLLTPPPQGDA